MNRTEYLNKWTNQIKTESNYEDFQEYKGIYKEMAEFLDAHLENGSLTIDAAINMSFSMLVNYLVEKNICPACELFEASNCIHTHMGCTDVH